MAKPRTVNQLLRSLGLSVSLAGAGAPACESQQPPAKDAVAPDGGARDLLIENPPWIPEPAPDGGRDADAGDPADVKEAGPTDLPYVAENPPWTPPEPQPDGGRDADAGDAADVKEAGPTDLPYLSENPPWVPEVDPADKPKG